MRKKNILDQIGLTKFNTYAFIFDVLLKSFKKHFILVLYMEYEIHLSRNSFQCAMTQEKMSSFSIIKLLQFSLNVFQNKMRFASLSPF